LVAAVNQGVTEADRRNQSAGMRLFIVVTNMVSPTNSAPNRSQTGWDGQQGRTDADRGRSDPADQHPLEPLLNHLAEIRVQAQTYLEARKDAVTVAIRERAYRSLLGVIGLLVLATVIVASTVMLISGLSELVSTIAGGRAWVGNLVIGAGSLLAIAGAVALLVARTRRTSRSRTIQKYENRHDAQRQSCETEAGRQAD
jgi:hypothetical protein